MVTNYISENISTDESVSCFDFTEESVNTLREHNFCIREFKSFIYTLHNIIIHNINYNT